MMQKLWHDRFTIVFGIVFGLLVAPWIFTESTSYLKSTYSKFYPVVRYQSEIIKREGDGIHIHIWGEKLRDCEAVPDSLNSYAIVKGTLYGIHEKRLTGDPSSRPVGKVDLGVWVVWPVAADSETIVMIVKHNCDGHMVTSEIARVKL